MGTASAIGEGLLAGAKTIARPAIEAAENGFEKLASSEHIFNKYPEIADFATRYRTDYVQTEKSLTAKALQQELDLRKTGKINTPIDTESIAKQARSKARQVYLGPGDEDAVIAAQGLDKKYGLHAAQSFSDTLAYLLKDRVALTNPKTGTVLGYTSPLKTKVGKVVEGINASPTYIPKTPAEKAVANYAHLTFAPLLAIPHLTTVFNSLMGTDVGTFISGLTRSVIDGLGDKSLHFQNMIDNGVMAESLMRETEHYNKYVSSGRTFKFPGDSIMGILHKTMYQPGFGPLRKMTLLSSGIMGDMTAKQVALDFAKNPNNQRLLWQLKEFGLDAGKILKQGGRLNKEDTEKAVFTFVDKHVFIDNKLQTSRFLGMTPTGRTLGIFHSYVTRQAKFMYRAMFKDIQARGPASVLKNLAVGGILFPMLGEGVKILGEGVRGQNALGDLNKDINNLSGDNGSTEMLATYLGMLSHVGAVGVYAHMYRGAATHSLLEKAAGPAIGSVADLVQDIVAASAKTQKNGQLGKNLKPVGRDLMYDIPGVSLGGQLLGHRFFPKSNENPANDPLAELYEHIRSDKQDQEDQQ